MEEKFSRAIILIITLVSLFLLVLNVILISCYVKRRGARKHLHGKRNPTKSNPSLLPLVFSPGVPPVSNPSPSVGLSSSSGGSGDGNSVLLIIVAVVCALLFVLVNVFIVSFCLRRRLNCYLQKEGGGGGGSKGAKVAEDTGSSSNSTGSSTCGGEGKKNKRDKTPFLQLSLMG